MKKIGEKTCIQSDFTHYSNSSFSIYYTGHKIVNCVLQSNIVVAKHGYYGKGDSQEKMKKY